MTDKDALGVALDELHDLSCGLRNRASALAEVVRAMRRLGMSALADELSAQVDEMLSVADRLPAIAKTVSREAVLAADRASKNLYEVALVASARRPENP